MVAKFCSGRLRPERVTVAASRDEDSTLTSTAKSTPGAFAAAARSIAVHSAAAPPDASGSLSPSTTRQDADELLGDAMAQAPPDKDAAIMTTTGPSMIRRSRRICTCA